MSVPRTTEQKARRKRYSAAYRKSAHGRAMRKKWLKTTALGKAAKRSMHLVSRYGITWKRKVEMYEEQGASANFVINRYPQLNTPTAT